MDHDERQPGQGGSQFLTTSWSLVLAASDPSDQAAAALESLCRKYWYPLYAYLRRSGHAPHDAEDLTQGFFLHFLRRQDLARVDPQKGRFRSYLLTALRHYVSDQRSHDRAAKRGGGQTPLPLDGAAAEATYCLEPGHDLTPERLFDRRWALAVLDQTLFSLRQRYADEGKEPLFDALKGSLVGGDHQPAHAETAEALGMSEGAVKVAVHRLRLRFGQLLRAAVADTVASEDEVEDEIRSLLAALRS